MKNFLNEDQVTELVNKQWVVKPKCFRNTFYKDELPSNVWNSLCKIAGVNGNGCSKITLLSVGVIDEK